jgi:hypothetical protein
MKVGGPPRARPRAQPPPACVHACARHAGSPRACMSTLTRQPARRHPNPPPPSAFDRPAAANLPRPPSPTQMALYAAPNCLTPQYATAAGDKFGWATGLDSRCYPVKWLFNNGAYQFPDSTFKDGWKDAVCFQSTCNQQGKQGATRGPTVPRCPGLCRAPPPPRACVRRCTAVAAGLYQQGARARPLSAPALSPVPPPPPLRLPQARCRSNSLTGRSTAPPAPCSTCRNSCQTATARARSAPAPTTPPRAPRSRAGRRARWGACATGASASATSSSRVGGAGAMGRSAPRALARAAVLGGVTARRAAATRAPTHAGWLCCAVLCARLFAPAAVVPRPTPRPPPRSLNLIPPRPRLRAATDPVRRLHALRPHARRRQRHGRAVLGWLPHGGAFGLRTGPFGGFGPAHGVL